MIYLDYNLKYNILGDNIFCYPANLAYGILGQELS